jgi:nucleotide-binding universal stress UspA family protein
MILLQRILVATDFGEAAEAALNHGREFARHFGASLDVVHVCDDVFARGLGVDGFAFDYAGVERDLEAAARRQLDALQDNEDRAILNTKSIF